MSGLDVWAMVAPRIRPPREFTQHEVDQFAAHWAKALDTSLDFRAERLPEAVKACKALFPRYPIAGYGPLALALLRMRLPAAEAMRRLWKAPMPATREMQRQELAHLAGLVSAAEARHA